MGSTAGTGREPALHAGKGFPGLRRALAGQGSILEVFPQFGFFEVDDDIGFLVGLVDDESHAFHEKMISRNESNIKLPTPILGI
jgi:hypothetical protein